MKAQKKTISAASILKPLVEEIENQGVDVFDESWNPSMHVELTLTRGECLEIVRLYRMLKRIKPQVGTTEKEAL